MAFDNTWDRREPFPGDSRCIARPIGTGAWPVVPLAREGYIRRDGCEVIHPVRAAIVADFPKRRSVPLYSVLRGPWCGTNRLPGKFQTGKARRPSSRPA
jgi:hypothetical protein